MKFKEYIMAALSTVKSTTEDYIFMIKNRKTPKDFSRNRKMGFKETLLFMMNMVKKSLQVELIKFFDEILDKTEIMSKQAYSEARSKIKPEAFIELNDKIVDGLYAEVEDIKLWKGYRLCAIDGTVLEIPNTKVLREEFGVSKNQSGEVARAQGACIYDVLNKVIIKSKIDGYRTGERDMAKNMIEQMNTNRKYSDIIIFDRGYPSAEMVSFLYEKKIDFLMRVKKSFSNQIIKATKDDQVINMTYNGKDYPVRVIRIKISNETEEVLISSLLDIEITTQVFKELYFLRWNIETKYDDLKNKLQIENFTGATKTAIEQDFYASMFLSNMIEFAKYHSDAIIKEKHKDKDIKYEYKTNLNVLVGTFKDKLVMILLEEDDRIREMMFNKIMKMIVRSTVPIRKGRQNSRNKFLNRSKYQLNKKRCL